MPKNRKETYSDKQSSASRAKRKTPEQKLAEFSNQIASTAHKTEPGRQKATGPKKK
jgi:hypothetical protein